MPNLIKTNLIFVILLIISACAQQPQSSIPTLAEGMSPADEGVFSSARRPFRDHWHPLERVTPSYISMPYQDSIYDLRKDFSSHDSGSVQKTAQKKFFIATGTKKNLKIHRSSLWDRIRSKLSWTNLKNPRIDKHVDYLKRDPYHIYTLSKRARPFLYYIVEAIENRNLPIELALVPMIESGFEPDAVSPAQAGGLWQIMPTTGKYLGLTSNNWYDGRFDISDSTKAALDYLEYLYNFFDGDWLLALAAYNAGEGTVQQAIRENRKAGKATDYWDLKLPRDTQIYVPKILALCRMIANSDAYGVDLQPIANEPYLDRVKIGPDVNLSLAATLAGMPKAELQYLNPGFTRGVTPPKESHKLLLPRNKALALQKKLAQLNNPSGQRYYIVKRGDTLSHIARRYGVSYHKLARWNGLTSKNILKPGKKLVIYSPAAPTSEEMLASNEAG